jgi:hypothetical protein
VGLSDVMVCAGHVEFAGLMYTQIHPLLVILGKVLCHKILKDRPAELSSR